MSVNPVTQPENTEQGQSNDKEYNFAQIRRQLEQERREKQELEQKTLILAQKVDELVQNRQAAPEEVDEDEPYVNPKTLEKKFTKWEQKIEKTIEKKAEEKARALVEEERRHNYLNGNKDFDDVMNVENIKKFAEKHPTLAQSILSMPDGFERQKLVYENIKALNVLKAPEPKTSIQDALKNERRNLFYQPTGGAAPPYAAAGDFSKTGLKAGFDKMKELQSRLRGFPS